MTTGIRMIFSVLTTVLVAFALLAMAVNVVQTACFRADPPTGNDAIGVIVLLIAAIVGGVMMLLATGTCAATGGLGWVTPRTSTSFGLAAIITLGIGLGATAIVWIWAEPRTSFVVPMGVANGLIAPVALALVLLFCAWMPTEAVRHPRLLRAIGAALCVGALSGYALSGLLVVRAVNHAAENDRRTREAYEARDREAARKNALPLIDLLREEYPAMGEAAPLWSFVARLPDTRDDATRQFIIARALKVPEFDESLRSTATTGHPRYRHGCLDLIRFAPQAAIQPSWPAIVDASMAVTVSELTDRPTWLTAADDLANPDPIEHVRAIVDAARRVEPNATLESLRSAVAALPENDARQRALRLFDR